jgi:hypothetical protein
LNPTAGALFLLLVALAMPAAAQSTAAGANSGPPAPAAQPGSNTGPFYLPSLPQSGYGVPSPIQPSNTAPPNPEAAPQNPGSLRLPSPGAGITPLQQVQPAAPAILVLPTATLGEMLTSNANNTATDHVADIETRLMPGLSVSADTPRLKGILNGNLEYDKYAVTTNNDRFFGNLYASGSVTALPEHLFLDVKSAVSQAATFGAAGFTPISQLPKSQVTEVYGNTASPYFRESYGGLLDAELRYRVTSTIYGGSTTALQAPVFPALTPTAGALSNSLTNDGTLILATGRDFSRLLSRLTIDTSQTNAAPGSVIPNSRVTAYDDVEYRITSTVSALGRFGYENIRYPFAPSATASGLLWQAGGRLALGPGAQYLSLRYGLEEGIYGATGSLRYEITPATVLTAEATQGVGSQQTAFGNTLAGSSLDAYGQLVDQYNLPTAFFNPEFGLQNNVFRTYLYSAGVTTMVGANHFFLFSVYDHQVSLAFMQPPTTSISTNFGWSREIRPDLTALASVGFANVTNQTLVTSTAPTAVTTVPHQNTATVSLSLNYLFSETLTGSMVYSLYYQANPATFGSTSTGTGTGNVVTNQLLFLLTKHF